MSGAADNAWTLLLLLAVCGHQDDIKQQRLSRIFLQQTIIHSLQRLKNKIYKNEDCFKSSVIHLAWMNVITGTYRHLRWIIVSPRTHARTQLLILTLSSGKATPTPYMSLPPSAVDSNAERDVTATTTARSASFCRGDTEPNQTGRSAETWPGGSPEQYNPHRTNAIPTCMQSPERLKQNHRTLLKFCLK